MTQLQTHETPLAGGVSQGSEAGGFDKEASTPSVDLREADRFLSILSPEAEGWCFRTFPDAEGGDGRKYAGELAEAAKSLQRDNGNGRGVYVVVNEGGQDDDSITRVRAVFADFDPPKTRAMPETFELEPHLIVESSRGKHHVYWLVDDLPVERFGAVQKAVAARYGSDTKVCNPSRVMRVPGFLHRKGKPYPSRIVHESGGLPYPAATVLAAFPPAAKAEHTPAASTAGAIHDGGRDNTLTSLAGTMRRRGMTEAEILAALRVVNAERCTPPLPEADVARIARSVARYEPAPERPPSPTTFTWGDELTSPDQLRPSEWAVYKLLPAECTGLLYGGWGTCKTFVAIDLACCIQAGIEWHGKRTRQGTVFYLAGEGEGGFARRLKAWEVANGHTTRGLAFTQMPKVRDPGELERLAQTIEVLATERGEPRLIVLDTLFTALDGGEENGGKDMGEVFAAMLGLRKRFRCAVLAVHHTGKADNGPRGHSSMPAGVDVQFALKSRDAPSGHALELSNPKQKDGPGHPVIFLSAEAVPLPGLFDEEGTQEQSLVIRAPAAELMAQMREQARAPVKAELVELARSLRDKGHTLDEIAEQVGRDKSTVSRWLK